MLKSSEMPKAAGERKRIVTILLALIGIVLVVFYTWCTDACGRVSGEVAGVKLSWAGIAFMGLVAAVGALRRESLVFLLSSVGIGVEAFLVGYQVRTGEYCVYCLLFAATVAALFLTNFSLRRARMLLVAVPVGFLMLFFGFTADPIPAYAATTPIPTFGSGPVTVRLYTDYYCGPCSSVEKAVEEALAVLARGNDVRVTFVDTPLHKETSLYAAYFLYAVNGSSDINHALRARSLLFDAAREKIADREKLEAFLRKNGLSLAPFDAGQTLRSYNGLLKEDRITTTPTLVIYRGGKRETYTGTTELLKGIDSLKRASRRS
ncbi:vitamin K epoxide reductase family protein [Geobacter pickeringii]|uniref:Uncharacterized protein n=1 Tax=Geobacter pickeringii TaxID=345632 RepID=A0A0B5B9I1_9BACT|nr:thioredoxin domain-containing protein [Geobacter pickeringii]AJE03227.1 hypothetical protein GPICK_07535 [Geobacter pickeringii]